MESTNQKLRIVAKFIPQVNYGPNVAYASEDYLALFQQSMRIEAEREDTRDEWDATKMVLAMTLPEIKSLYDDSDDSDQLVDAVGAPAWVTHYASGNPHAVRVQDSLHKFVEAAAGKQVEDLEEADLPALLAYAGIPHRA